MAIDVEQLQSIEAELGDDMLARWAVGKRLEEAGLPEVAKFIGKLQE